jgi:hypothetical protein
MSGLHREIEVPVAIGMFVITGLGWALVIALGIWLAHALFGVPL